MKEPVKITSQEQLSSLLEEFKDKLHSKLPYDENALLTYRPIVGQGIEATLETNSSGIDKYMIYVDNTQTAGFIRCLY